MFIGRKNELKALENFLEKGSGAALVYGKRRVGKTTLIRKALSDKNQELKCIYFECIRDSMEENVRRFSHELQKQGLTPTFFPFERFEDAIEYLASLSGRTAVVLDEYPYLKAANDSDAVDSVFQSILDRHHKNISFIFSGSHVSMMKELIEKKNPLFGRFSLVLNLGELNYKEAAEFYPDKSPYEKVAFHSVFGGSPFVLSEIDSKAGLRENIINTVLNMRSSVYAYVDRTLLSEYTARQSLNAERIFSVLGNGRKRYSEIERSLNADKSGNLNKQLKTLIDMELVKKINPINRADNPKKTGYEINDNLMRFYYSFVAREKSMLELLGPEAFFDEFIETATVPFISHRFEELCRDYFSLKVQSGKLKGIKRIGTYYYDDARGKKNGEFDVALECREGYMLFEAKYLKKPLTMDEIHRELAQIREIEGISVYKSGFISINGFDKKVNGENLILISGNELYQ